MIKFAHLVYIPFTGVGLNKGFRGDDWLAYRIELFKKYTLRSLKNQTNKVFLIWMSFRPEEENHPLVKELGQHLNEQKMPTIMTFDGLMYWDDKFSTDLKSRIMNAGRVLRDILREKSIRPISSLLDIFKNKNKTLLPRLEKSLFRLREFREFNDANYIYLTRIDSDDMFHKEAIAELQGIKPFEGALVHKNGYVYNSNTDEMAEWIPDTNPPFHTIIFLGSIFFNPVEHLRYYKDFRSHEDVTRVFETKQLKPNRYCVLVHKKHISTVFDHPFKGKKVDNKLLNDFI